MTMLSENVTKPELLSIARALVDGGDLSAEEHALCNSLPSVAQARVIRFRERILSGEHPLGSWFCSLSSAAERKPLGATYTPQTIVKSMVGWAKRNVAPARAVDPGCGSGRFLVDAASQFPKAEMVGIEIDPAAALLARATMATVGAAERTRIVIGDFRSAKLTPCIGQTLFIGNPPYVRHHLINSDWKDWFVNAAARYGVRASQLAGLHVHFFLAALEHARTGDAGVFITAAEWLDVNYGLVLRQLLLKQLGGRSIHIVEPEAMPFPDATTTASITCFQVGAKVESVGFRRVASLSELGSLEAARDVSQQELLAAKRWTPLSKGHNSAPHDMIELGELFRVDRNQVTGANKVWIEGAHTKCLPESVLYRSITKAKELFRANGSRLTDAVGLKRVVDLPVDLDELSPADRRLVDTFLAFARTKGADTGFIATHRKAWRSVGLREPSPILASYMARRPPAFVRNTSLVRHVNVAHGLYPRQPLSDTLLGLIVTYLANGVSVQSGRTYAGGLTKFEPGEMQRIHIPTPSLLEEMASC